MSFDEDGGRIRKICEGWWSSMLLSGGCYEGGARTRNPNPKGSASMVCLLFVYIITLPDRGGILMHQERNK